MAFARSLYSALLLIALLGAAPALAQTQPKGLARSK